MDQQIGEVTAGLERMDELARLRDGMRYFAQCMKGNFYALEGRGEREMVSADVVRGIARSALGMAETDARTYCERCGQYGYHQWCARGSDQAIE